jgi:hypothetical protein
MFSYVEPELIGDDALATAPARVPARVSCGRQGIPASFSAWVILAALCPASRWLRSRGEDGLDGIDDYIPAACSRDLL